MSETDVYERCKQLGLSIRYVLLTSRDRYLKSLLRTTIKTSSVDSDKLDKYISNQNQGGDSSNGISAGLLKVIVEEELFENATRARSACH